MSNIYCPSCGSQKIRKAGTHKSKQRYECTSCGHKTVNPKKFIVNDKNVPEFDFREWTKHLKEKQGLKSKHSGGQLSCNITFKTDHDFIIYHPMADTHIGNIGVDYEALENWTDNIIKIPNLYISFSGDMVDKYSNFKSMMPIHQMVLTPEEQDAFIDSWTNEINHKILFSGWGNHEEMEEKASGINNIRTVLNKKMVYFDGIGVCNIKLNDIDYKIVSTHKTPGSSVFNPTHGLKRLGREQIPDADIYISGHIHNPCLEQKPERGMWQVFATLGSLKMKDTFARRYFNHYAYAPTITMVLNTKRKEVTPFRTLNEALFFTRQEEYIY